MSKSTNKVYAMHPRRDSMPMMGGVPPPFTDFGVCKSFPANNVDAYWRHKAPESRNDTLSTMTRCVPSRARTCKITMPISGTNPGPMKPSRRCKQNAAWLHSENESFETITRSSNTIEVSRLV